MRPRVNVVTTRAITRTAWYVFMLLLVFGLLAPAAYIHLGAKDCACWKETGEELIPDKIGTIPVVFGGRYIVPAGSEGEFLGVIHGILQGCPDR